MPLTPLPSNMPVTADQVRAIVREEIAAWEAEVVRQVNAAAVKEPK
jgi:hypothetical protein